VTVRIALEISGFASDEHAETLADSIRQVLKTPEEYLAANGVQFDLPAGAENQELTKSSGPLDHPEVLMSVDGAYTEEARKKRLSGAVTMKVVVGSDGRIHDARISQGMGSGLDENALQVIRMWRFKPAMQGGQPIARPATIAMNFKIY
jgi:TonB family protein